jgi:hypothetical protein
MGAIYLAAAVLITIALPAPALDQLMAGTLKVHILVLAAFGALALAGHERAAAGLAGWGYMFGALLAVAVVEFLFAPVPLPESIRTPIDQRQIVLGVSLLALDIAGIVLYFLELIAKNRARRIKAA